jgi:hypothetical protein
MYFSRGHLMRRQLLPSQKCITHICGLCTRRSPLHLQPQQSKAQMRHKTHIDERNKNSHFPSSSQSKPPPASHRYYSFSLYLFSSLNTLTFCKDSLIVTNIPSEWRMRRFNRSIGAAENCSGELNRLTEIVVIGTKQNVDVVVWGMGNEVR